MDPNEANSYAKQLEVEASAIFARILTERVPGDQLVEMGRKLAESMRYRRALGQVGNLGDGTCEMVMAVGEFGGQKPLGASGEPYRVASDGLVRIVDKTVYDDAYAIGELRSLDSLPDGGVQIIYRPRFGGFVEPLANDQERVDLDRKTRWLAAFSTDERSAVMRQLDALGRSVRDVTGWSPSSDSGPALVELADLSGILVWPDGTTSVQTVGWSGTRSTD